VSSTGTSRARIAAHAKGRRARWRVPVLALVMTLAGSLTAHAYRTAGDLEDFAGTERVGWPAGVTSFTLVDDVPGAVGGSDVNAELVRRALRAWGEVGCSSAVASLEGSTSSPAEYGDGINSIQWLRSGWEEHGFQPGASGATDVRYEEQDGEWVIAEADVYLNVEAHDWITGLADDETPAGAVEIVGVMTHELGHALGLLHPCEEHGEPLCTEAMAKKRATMYPAYSHGQLELKSDDVDGICFLYPACTPESCSDGEVCEKNGCAVVCAGKTCKSGELCIEERCVDWTDPCAVSPESCIRCDSNEDCDDGFECRGASCVPRFVAAGDPCEVEDACASGACNEAQYCAPNCSDDVDCGEGGRCDSKSGTCSEDSRQPLGGSCDSADDCVAGRCLSDLTETPLCTRICDIERDDCPFEWQCDEVEGEAVCVPSKAPGPASPGCSFVDISHRRSFFSFFASLLFGLGLLRRRKVTLSYDS
jgi:hypothetical protein